MIKLVTSRIALLAIVAAALATFAGRADAASIQDCTWCHGPSSQGFGPAPRLAGQRFQYMENQLRALYRHTRDNPFSKQFMWGAAANLSPKAARDFASYFSTLHPKAANDGDQELAAAGRKIYESGNPQANIVSCAVCHGPHAEGIRQIPRLGGLSYYYLKRRLEQWGEGYHATAEYPMPQVARNLPPRVIEQLASYLSFVK
jgi:cytochrome c553